MSWRRIWLLSFALVLLLGTATWLLLQRSDAATAIARRELQALFLAPVHLGGTTLDLGRGRLSAHDFRLADPTRPGATLLAVEAADVDVAVASGALVGLHAVHLRGFTVDMGPEIPAPARLLAAGDGKASSPLRVPPVTATGGVVRAQPRAGEPPVELMELAFELAPDPTTGALQVRGGALLPELGGRLTLGGEYDPRTGAAALHAELEGARLDQANVARAARLFGTSLPVFTGGALVRNLRVTTTLRASEPTRWELQGELAGVRVDAADWPALVTDAAIELQASSDHGVTAALRLQQTSTRGTLDITADARELHGDGTVRVRLNGTNIAIDADVVKALQLFDAGRDVVRALQPGAGRADLELFLTNPHRAGGGVELDLRLADVALTYAGFGRGDERAAFPLPVERTSGRVRLRNDIVRIDDVVAHVVERAGGGTVRLLGRVDTTQPGGEDASIDVEATGVAFSADLRAALSQLLRDDGDLYDRFAPTGRTDVTVRLRPRRELPGGWSVSVRPRDATMQWAGFPYRLQSLRGEVVAREAGVEFDLQGAHGPGTLAMRGHIPLGDGGDSDGFHASVTLGGVQLDDDLRAAVAVLAPGLDRPWQDSAPRGAIGGEVTVWRARPDDPLSHDARLDFTAVDLALPAAPWRAVALHGGVHVQGFGASTRVDFDAVRGRLENGQGTPAQLAMLGRLDFGEAAGEDLAFVVRDLELDEQLGASLEQLDALAPGTWRSLQPSGRIDLVCRHRRTGERVEPLAVTVRLLDVRSEAAILPMPTEHMTGELQIANEELRFADVRAVLGGASVRCTDGHVRVRPAPDGRTEIAFTVDAQSIAIDDGVANLFADPLRTAVLQRQLLGRADLDALRLQFALPPAGNSLPFETTLGGQVRLYDLDMTLGSGVDAVVVNGISGVVTLADSRIDDLGGQLRGALRGVTFRLFGQPFENTDATFTADASRLTISALTMRCHGGVVQSARPDAPGIEYRLPAHDVPDGRLSADLTFEEVDVHTFLAESGWTNPPYSGAASGTLRIERLDGNTVLGALGNGTLRIDRADLGVVPLFTAIYAELPAADRPRFDGLETTWRVADAAVQFDTFDVRSSILAARGKGRLGFDGYLEVELTLDKLLGSTADPFVMPLIDYLAQNIVTFWLHGYLRDLRAEKRWFTEAKPLRRQVSPMPPATPRRTAPGF